MPERAVILAAGVGARLKWLTDDKPKALMPVAGEAMIVHVIRRLAAQGIHDIAINVHHHADQIVHQLGDGARFGVRLYFSREPILLDSGGGVKQALSLLPGDGPVVVHNADVFGVMDISRLAALLGQGCDAALALVPNPAHNPNGDFGLEDGWVRPQQISCPTYTYTGVSIFNAAAFDAFAEGRAFPLPRLLNRLCADQRLQGFIHRGGWLDVGRPRDFLRAVREVYIEH
ncbi:MAG: nucleotidyltransferase family protein [Mariprofundaceae bacterium]